MDKTRPCGSEEEIETTRLFTQRDILLNWLRLCGRRRFHLFWDLSFLRFNGIILSKRFELNDQEVRLHH